MPTTDTCFGTQERLEYERQFAVRACERSLQNSPSLGIVDHCQSFNSALTSTAQSERIETRGLTKGQRFPCAMKSASGSTAASCSEIEAALGSEHQHSIVDDAPKYAPVRLAADLNWSETRQLAEKRTLRPLAYSAKCGQGRSDGENSASGSECMQGTAETDSEEHNARRPGQTCKQRESVLWQTLRSAGLVSSCSGSSVRSGE